MWFHCFCEIVDGEVCRALEVIPRRHISKGEPSIFFDCFATVSDEAELANNLCPGIFYDERGLLDFLGPFLVGCRCPPV